MSAVRRRHPREFKIDAIKRVLEDGQPAAHVARDLGISPNTLAGWKREYLEDREHAFPGNGRQKPDDAELSRLRRENARLKSENDILKKAAVPTSFQAIEFVTQGNMRCYSRVAQKTVDSSSRGHTKPIRRTASSYLSRSGTLLRRI